MGLYDNMNQEPVRQLALRRPVLVRPTDTLRHAIERMRAEHLGCVIVVDDDQKPQGVFTESMVTGLVAKESLQLDQPVQEQMTVSWPWVKLTDPIREVLYALQAKNIRFLCVIDEEGRVAGLTGQKGLMEYVADHFPGQVMVQRIGGTPYPKSREGA
jgi:CBS domain-containing protein